MKLTNRRLVDTVILTVLVGLVLLPLVPVYGARAGLIPVLGGLLLGVSVALLAAVRKWSLWIAAALMFGAYLLFGPLLAAPTLALSGVLPGPEVLIALVRALVSVWKEALTMSPPFGRSGTLAALPFLTALFTSGAAVSIIMRAKGRQRLWALVPLIFAAAVGLLFTSPYTVYPVGVGVVVGLVIVGWAFWHAGIVQPKRWVSLLIMGAVAVTSGVVVPNLAEAGPRFVLRDYVLPPFDPSDLVSPLAQLRLYKKDLAETELFSVSGLPEGTRIRLATLDSYDGVVWNVAPAGTAQGSGSYRRVGEQITQQPAENAQTFELVILGLTGNWLPTVGQAEGFDFADGSRISAQLRYNDSSGAALLTGGLTEGLSYQVTAVLPPEPNPDDLSTAGASDLRLPPLSGVPAAVSSIAPSVSAEASNPYEIAQTIADWFPAQGWYSDSLAADSRSVSNSLAGHGANRIAQLLEGERMVGDHEQYAAAMALFAREMGLPARVVMGFVPNLDDDGAATVVGADVSAWVEIHFRGHGWVAFDPTPDTSKTPEQDTTQNEQHAEPQLLQPPPPPPDPAPPESEDTSRGRTSEGEEREEEAAGIPAVVWYAAGGVSGLLLLIFGPMLLVALIRLQRRKRRRNAKTPAASVAGGWDEVLDQAVDLKLEPKELATRREAASELVHQFSAQEITSARQQKRVTNATEVVTALAHGADYMIFGPEDPSPENVAAYWQDVAKVNTALRATAKRRQRLRSRYSLRSIRVRKQLRRQAAGKGRNRNDKRVRAPKLITNSEQNR